MLLIFYDLLFHWRDGYLSTVPNPLSLATLSSSPEGGAGKAAGFDREGYSPSSTLRMASLMTEYENPRRCRAAMTRSLRPASNFLR